MTDDRDARLTNLRQELARMEPVEQGLRDAHNESKGQFPMEQTYREMLQEHLKRKLDLEQEITTLETMTDDRVTQLTTLRLKLREMEPELAELRQGHNRNKREWPTGGMYRDMLQERLTRKKEIEQQIATLETDLQDNPPQLTKPLEKRLVEWHGDPNGPRIYGQANVTLFPDSPKEDPDQVREVVPQVWVQLTSDKIKGLWDFLPDSEQDRKEIIQTISRFLDELQKQREEQTR